MPPQRRSPPVHSVEKASLITAPTLELLALQLCLRNHPTPANQCPPLAALWRTPLAAGPPLAAFLASHAPQIPLAQFEQAYRFTSSRAFLIDQFRKYAIVPFADDFNHSNDQNVEVRAEYWVCPVCGCEGECAHDLDDGAVASGVGGSKAEQGMVEVVVCRAIAQGEEIFNSYGQLSNRQLLLQYGFSLDGNEHNRINFLPSLIDNPLSPRPLKILVEQWRAQRRDSRDSLHHLVEEIKLVLPSSDENSVLNEGEPASWSEEQMYSLNTEAKITRPLWLCIARNALSSDHSTADVLPALIRLEDYQLATLNTTDLQFSKAIKHHARFMDLLESVFERYRVSCPHLDRTGSQLLDIAESDVGEEERLGAKFWAEERLLLACACVLWKDMRDDWDTAMEWNA